MLHHLAHFVLVLMAFAASGCSHWGQHAKENYQTITADPNQDTARARELNGRALKLFAKGKIEPAEQALQKALIADVTFGPAHNNLGKHYFKQRKLYLAAWEFEYAMKLMPERPEPYNNLGLVYETAGKYDEAVEMFQQATHLDQTSAEYLGNFIRAHLRQGTAENDLREALQHLVFLDSRPDWIDWAEEKLALMPLDAPDTKNTDLPARHAIGLPNPEITGPSQRPGH